MRVLICGGSRTVNIVRAIEPKLSVGSVDIIVEEDIANIESLFVRGDYFDRAILIEQGITNDGFYNTEQQIRDRIYNFVNLMNEHGIGNSTFILVTASEIMARLMYEETLDLVEQTKIIVHKTSFTITFVSTLILRDLSDIKDEVYEYDVINTGTEGGNKPEETEEADTDGVKEEGVLSKPPEYKFPTEEDDPEIEDGGDVLEDPDEDPFSQPEDGDPFSGLGDPFESGGFDSDPDIGIEPPTDEDPDIGGDDWGFGADCVPEEKPTEDVDNPFGTDLGADSGFSNDELPNLEQNVEPDDTETFNVPQTELEGGFGGIEEDIGDGDDPFGDTDPFSEDTTPETSGETEPDFEYLPESDGDGEIEIPDDITEVEPFEEPFETPEDSPSFDSEFNPARLFEEPDGEPEELPDPQPVEPDLDTIQSDSDRVEDLFKAEGTNEDDISKQFQPTEQEAEFSVPSAPIAPVNTQPNITVRGRGKRGKNKNQPAPIQQQQQQVATSDLDQLKGMLNTFRTRGSSLIITGPSSSGKSTLAYNMTNIIVKLGYTALLVDMDTKGRSQAYISKQAYECIHSVDPSNASLRQALNTSNTTIGGYVNIISPGFHILTMGLAGDEMPANKLAPIEKLGRFANAVRNQYNFIIYDMPFDIATGYAKDITFTADNVILTVDHSNHGLMNLLLDMCNIENDDMTELMFRTSQICFTKAQRLAKVFGYKVATLKDILRTMDSEVYRLIGDHPDYAFSDMRICGQVPLDMRYEQCWMEKQQVSDTPDGLTMYAELLRRVLLNK